MPLAPLFGIRSAQGHLFSDEAFTHGAIHQPRLRVVNWNIAKNNHDPAWQAEIHSLSHHYQPDLLCLQEVRLNLQDPAYLPLTGMGWQLAPNFVRSQQAFGVLTASSIRHHRGQPLQTHDHEPLIRTPKAALITEYALAWSQQTLMLVNVHGINFVRSRKFQAQLHQIAAHISHHRGPLILLGDFNTWSGVRMEKLWSLANRLELQQVEFAPDCHRRIKRFLGSDPLDHVFYRGLAVIAENTRVLPTSTSDHRPLCVEFCLKESQTQAYAGQKLPFSNIMN